MHRITIACSDLGTSIIIAPFSFAGRSTMDTEKVRISLILARGTAIGKRREPSG